MATISVEDEEETIEEEEANEGLVDHQTELSNLAKEGRPGHRAASLHTRCGRHSQNHTEGGREPSTRMQCGGPCSPAHGMLGARPSVTAPSSRSGHLSSSAPSTSRVPEHTASLKCVRVSHGRSHTALGVHSVLCLCFAHCHASCELNSASLLHSTPHVPVAEVHHGGPLGCSWAHAQDPGRGSAPAWPAGQGVPERGWRGGSKLRVAWAPGVQPCVSARPAWGHGGPCPWRAGLPPRADPRMLLVCSDHTFSVRCVLRGRLPMRVLFTVPFMLLF